MQKIRPLMALNQGPLHAQGRKFTGYTENATRPRIEPGAFALPNKKIHCVRKNFNYPRPGVEPGAFAHRNRKIHLDIKKIRPAMGSINPIKEPRTQFPKGE